MEEEVRDMIVEMISVDVIVLMIVEDVVVEVVEVEVIHVQDLKLELQIYQKDLLGKI